MLCLFVITLSVRYVKLFGTPMPAIDSNQIKFIRYTRSQNTNRKLENRHKKHEANGVTRTQRQKPALTWVPRPQKIKNIDKYRYLNICHCSKYHLRSVIFHPYVSRFRKVQIIVSRLNRSFLCNLLCPRPYG